jgi:hypothetical protein
MRPIRVQNGLVRRTTCGQPEMSSFIIPNAAGASVKLAESTLDRLMGELTAQQDSSGTQSGCD